jgi:hypothetical protein
MLLDQGLCSGPLALAPSVTLMLWMLKLWTESEMMKKLQVK